MYRLLYNYILKTVYVPQIYPENNTPSLVGLWIF